MSNPQGKPSRKRTEAKHKKLAKALVKHDFDKQQAYAEVYPMAGRNTVKSESYNIHKKFPYIMEMAENIAQQAFNDAGATVQYLAEKTKGIIDKPIKEVQTAQGKLISLTDKDLQLKAINTALNVHTRSSTNTQHAQTINNVQVNVTDGTSDKLDAVLDGIQSMSRKLGITDDVQDGEIIDVEAQEPDGE